MTPNAEARASCTTANNDTLIHSGLIVAFPFNVECFFFLAAKTRNNTVCSLSSSCLVPRVGSRTFGVDG